jgi:hypothetical protein
MKEKGDHVLFARRIDLVGGPPVVLTSEGLQANRELSISDVITPLQVVGALIKHKADYMDFPDAARDTESLMKIYKYTSTNGYHIEDNDSHLKITRTKPVHEWQPPST